MRVFGSRKSLAVTVLYLIAALALDGAPYKDVAVVKDVSLNSNGGYLEAQIKATGDVRFTYFELESPRRLVVDFHGSENEMDFRERQVQRAGVERIRVSLFSDNNRQATRIVFDLASGVPYVIENDGGGIVQVIFGPAVEAESRPSEILMAGPPVFPELETERVIQPFSRPPLESSLLGQEEPLVAAPVARPAPAVPAAPSPQAGMEPLTAQQPIHMTPGPAAQYSGEIISLDLRDVDLRDFFRLIGEISGLNIIVDPNVSGPLTILLKDVPWDQALDIVLRNNQLGGQLQGNVLRIATNARLQAEKEEQKMLREAQELLVDMVTRPIILNYTRAETVAPTLRTLLSPRGSIIQDPRRNALIVTDVPDQFERVDEMVRFLDAPAQQVEIEARLLSANKSFSRDIGSQFGFLVGDRSGNVLTGVPGNPSPFERTPPPRVSSDGAGLPLIANFPAAAATSGLSFLIQPGGDIILDQIITLAETRGTARLISRPTVTTQNNQPATVEQGTQIPVQTVVNNTVTVQFLTFALQLQVTPQITDAGTILLDVQIENSQPDFGRAVGGVPSIATQRAQTQVLVPDGGTAVIAGILVDTDSANVNQVPGLGSIPVIGHLFKNTQTIKSTTELLFFITSRIKPQDTLDLLGQDPPQETPAEVR